MTFVKVINCWEESDFEKQINGCIAEQRQHGACLKDIRFSASVAECDSIIIAILIFELKGILD